MLVLAGIIAAAFSGHLAAYVAGMSFFAWAQLTAAGISLPRDVARIERFLRELDRRHPCGRKCHAEIASRRFEMNGGPIGWGRSPFKNI